MITPWKVIAKRVAVKLNIPEAEVINSVENFRTDLRAAMQRLESPEYDFFYIARLMPMGSKLSRRAKKDPEIDALYKYYKKVLNEKYKKKNKKP